MDKIEELGQDNISQIIFITGGTKSGKSKFAEFLAKESKQLTYIALSEDRPKDKIWQNKILIHRKRRPKEWDLIETIDLIGALKKVNGPVLIDSIGGFVMENININDIDWIEKVNRLINLLKKRNTKTLIVGEQVGWGLVSEYKIGNVYIDRIGEIQERITKISNENWLTVNGRAIKLNNISYEIPT